MGSAGARRPAKPPCARLNCWRLNTAQGLILLGWEPWCGMVDPAPVMPEFNITRVRTRPHRGGRAFKIDLSQSHCPQHPETCVPIAWPQSHLHGTGDKGHRLPVLAASAGFPSMGSSKLGARTHPFLPLGVMVAMGTSSSILHRSQCCLPHTGSPGAMGLCHVLGHRCQGPSPAPRISAHHPLHAAGGDETWQGTRACKCGQALAGDAGSSSQLSAHALLLAALPGDRSLLACICCRGDALYSPPASFGCEPASARAWAEARAGMLGSGTAHGPSIPPFPCSSVVQGQTPPEPRCDAGILRSNT